MNKEIDLWVCPHCHILQGIETTIAENNTIICNCLSCGITLPFQEVGFLTENLVRDVINYVKDCLPNDMLTHTRFSWVSNKTIGIILDYAREDLYEAGIDPEDFVDGIEDRFSINATLFYEY